VNVLWALVRDGPLYDLDSRPLPVPATAPAAAS